MKYTLCSCAILLALSATAPADPLNKQHVLADAKWLVHLDCDSLRQTRIGEFLLNKFVQPKLSEVAGEMDMNASNIIQRINSLTAFGADFTKGDDANGVLLINADDDTKKALEGMLVAQILANTNGPVKKLAGDKALYSLANQVFVSPQKHGPIILSKSESQIEAARELLDGKTPSLATTKTFGEFPAVANSFFFVGVADASNLPHAIPARAKVLQMAEGGRIALGESAGQVFLDLALRGKSAEVTRQMQQVVEGMVALVAIGQPDNPEITGLAKSAKVSSSDQLISISLEYPASKVIDKLNDELAPKAKPAKVQRQKDKEKAKAKAKQKAKAEKDIDKSEATGESEQGAKPAAPAKPESDVENK